MEQETKPIVVRKIPVDLWRRLKVHAAGENETVQTTVAKAIAEYLKRSA